MLYPLLQFCAIRPIRENDNVAKSNLCKVTVDMMRLVSGVAFYSSWWHVGCPFMVQRNGLLRISKFTDFASFAKLKYIKVSRVLVDFFS